MRLIDKDALVAEIERRTDELWALIPDGEKVIGDKHTKEDAFNLGKYTALESLDKFLDTLEVKEVELEKEMVEWHRQHFKKEGTFDRHSGFYLANNSQLDLAKHFFELGLKANNPITAADRGTAEEIIFNLKKIESDYCVCLTKEIEWVRKQVGQPELKAKQG